MKRDLTSILPLLSLSPDTLVSQNCGATKALSTCGEGEGKLCFSAYCDYVLHLKQMWDICLLAPWSCRPTLNILLLILLNFS